MFKFSITVHYDIRFNFQFLKSVLYDLYTVFSRVQIVLYEKKYFLASYYFKKHNFYIFQTCATFFVLVTSKI